MTDEVSSGLDTARGTPHPGISRVAGALVIPWQIVGLTVPATFLLVATASACAALAATRRPPIAAVGARE